MSGEASERQKENINKTTGSWAPGPLRQGGHPALLAAAHRSAGGGGAACAHSTAPRGTPPPGRATVSRESPVSTLSEIPSVPWGWAEDTHCTDHDDMTTGNHRPQKPAPPKPCLPGSRTRVLSRGYPGLRPLGGIREDLQKTCQEGETNPNPAWALPGQGRPPTRLGPGPGRLVPSRMPGKGVAQDPISSSSHRC